MQLLGCRGAARRGPSPSAARFGPGSCWAEVSGFRSAALFSFASRSRASLVACWSCGLVRAAVCSQATGCSREALR